MKIHIVRSLKANIHDVFAHMELGRRNYVRKLIYYFPIAYRI